MGVCTLWLNELELPAMSPPGTPPGTSPGTSARRLCKLLLLSISHGTTDTEAAAAARLLRRLVRSPAAAVWLAGLRDHLAGGASAGSASADDEELGPL